MNTILKEFFSISGQKANESKIIFYFPLLNTSFEIRDNFEQDLNILSTNDLGTYLGFPYAIESLLKTN